MSNTDTADYREESGGSVEPEVALIAAAKGTMNDAYVPLAEAIAILRHDEAVQDGVAKHYYVSTYCVHELHDECRLICKHCHAPCLCPCHPQSGRADG